MGIGEKKEPKNRGKVKGGGGFVCSDGDQNFLWRGKGMELPSDNRGLAEKEILKPASKIHRGGEHTRNQNRPVEICNCVQQEKGEEGVYRNGTEKGEKKTGKK